MDLPTQKLILLKNDKRVKNFVNSLKSKNLPDFMERRLKKYKNQCRISTYLYFW